MTNEQTAPGSPPSASEQDEVERGGRVAWVAGKVTRENAGGELWGLVRHVNGIREEHPNVEPSHSRVVMEERARQINALPITRRFDDPPE